MKYLLIDGNNLAIRSAFANEGLSNADGVPTGVHYGVFNSIMKLKDRYSDRQFLIVWDGKSKRRMEESKTGVEKGLIKSTYKANRIKDEQPKALLDFYEQSLHLKIGIDQTGIPQIRLSEFEADDVVSSYCKKLGKDSENDIIVVTSDKDYYQLLSDNISMYDGMKDELITKETFQKKYGIDPSMYVDVGALMGDTGDNIHGVPGWGEKTAFKAIQDYNNWKEVIKHLEEMYAPIRQQYPDVKDDDFQKLVNLRTDKEQEKFDAGQEWKGKYPEITENMPYTGVALAFENGTWKPPAALKKGFKANIMALMFADRIELAYSLKKMDDEIPEIPKISNGVFQKDKLIEYFDYYEIESLKNNVDVLK